MLFRSTRAKYLTGLKRAVRTGVMPEDWEVNLSWRNPDTKKGRTKEWQTGDFETVLAESNDGFRKAVMNILLKQGGEEPLTPAQPVVKKKPAPAPAPKKKAKKPAKKKAGVAKKGKKNA